MKRLKIEHLNLQKEPVPLALARPKEDNILEWRFLIQGTEGTDYEGGFYHGKLIFPPQYPMKPPGIMFCTPSGRFEINKRVCLTISDFHPETWSPLWTVGSILTGIVSFMNSEEMTTGGLAASSTERKALALASTAYNAKDKVYAELFGNGEPSELFRESTATMLEFAKKRQEKSLMAATIPKKVQGVVTKAAPGDGTKVELPLSEQKAGPSKSSKKRAKEKEKSRRLKEEAGNDATKEEEEDDDGDVSGASVLADADCDTATLLADMKLSGDGR